ncbi:MAG TPA: hypothetical protein VMW41_00600 [Candidatus Bathyarchaeia archaeon]|nr:hypothetical protein [Candidatus Bathyarchaeia archaeon]
MALLVCLAPAKEPITRDSLQRVAGDLRQRLGPTVLAQRVWQKIVSAKRKKAVIDSIRGIEEVEFLKEQPGFWLVSVSAKPRLRFQRMIARDRAGDPTTWPAFLKNEERDKYSEGRNITVCLKAADFQLINNSAPEDLYRQIETVLARIAIS